MNYKNIVITGVSSFGRGRYYFRGIKILYNTCRIYSDCIDKLIIYDWGIDDQDKKWIHKKSLESNGFIELRSFNKDVYNYYDSLNVDFYKYYCYKYYCDINAFLEFPNSNVFWLDAGVCFIDNPKEIFDIISKQKLFVVEHDDQNTIKWIDEHTIKCTNASQEELNSSMVFGGIVGFNTNNHSLKVLFNEFYSYVKNPEIVRSIKESGGYYQAILSILVDRYRHKKYNHRKYAEHLGIKTRKDQIIFVHRCDRDNLEKIKTYFGEDILY